MSSFSVYVTALAACLLAIVHSATAATLPSGFAETQLDLGNLELDPTSMSIAPDGRIFICEKDGVIRVIKNDVLLGEPFLQVPVQNYNEQGLQSMAFDPNFAENGYVYVYYTALTGSPFVGFNRVSRFTANGDVAVPGSEVVLLEMHYPGSDQQEHQSALHNGGALHFRDGHLYVAVGDDQNEENAQDLTNRFGKILRINPDPENLIPADNPFVGQSGVEPTIWAYGLRNAFTFAFDPASGRMFINDVGAALWEEINDGIAGANYGWPRSEGETQDPAFTGPLYAYPHREQSQTPPPHGFYAFPHTLGCAITGGAFYSPATAPFPAEYVGRYFFADYCNGEISTIDPDVPMDVRTFATGVDRCVDIDIAADGSLYYIARGGEGSGTDTDNTSSNNGRIFRVVYTGSEIPTIASQPSDVTAPVGENATFSIVASGTEPSYQWTRNGENIPGATSDTLNYGPVTLDDDGATFACVVSNTFGAVTSEAATLSVTSNSRPTATIVTPAEDALYEGGSVLSVTGTGADAEDGDLPAAAFEWKIDFHHDTHFHPGMPATSGMKEFNHTIEASGHETSSNVWYRIYLTVTDSAGLSHTVARDVHPRLAALTLATEPAGLNVRLDGSPQTTPFAFNSVVGMERQISVEDPQVLNGVGYRFEGWSDGGSRDHTIVTPATDTTYTANFVAAPDTVGIGLKGEYFTESFQSLEGDPTLVRDGEAVNFDWGLGSPDPLISIDNFTARWTGQIQPEFTEDYTFHVEADDGVRLWIDGVLLIDEWIAQAATHTSAPVALTAGNFHSVRLEYFESGGEAVAKLRWSSSSQPEVAVPQSRLYPHSTIVTVEASDMAAVEGGNQGEWLVTRSGPTEQALTVNYALSGSATFGEDYTLSSGADSVTIETGQSSAAISLTVLADTQVEGTETATLTLEASEGYGLGTASGSIEIADSPFDAWKVSQFGGVDNAKLPEAADLGDWDGDGAVNILEYAVGSNPTTAGDNGLPHVGRERVDNADYLTISFTRRNPAPDDITYIIESSDGLGSENWTPAEILPSFPNDNGDGTETVTARDTVPVSNENGRFIRLRITRP